MVSFQYDIDVKMVVMFQYDNVEGVTILLPADDQDISIQVRGV